MEDRSSSVVEVGKEVGVSVMKQADFNEIIAKLAQIHKLGILQLAAYKERKSGDTVRRGGSFTQLGGIWQPHHVVVGKLISEPKLFLLENVEQYWTLYRSALDIFESPSVQFLMRTIMEMAYSRIVLYSQKPVNEQRDIALKFWICINGLLIKESVKVVGNKFGPKEYTVLVQLLSNEHERDYFLDLQRKGYPFSAFQKKLYELLPSATLPDTEKQLSEILVDLWGEESLRAYPIGRLIRYMSMLIHGNPVTIRQLESERENREHVLRCAKVLQFTGITVLKLAEREFETPVPDQSAFRQLEHDFGAYLMKLWKDRGRF